MNADMAFQMTHATMVEPTKVEEEAFQCPGCNRQMLVTQINNAEIDICRSCNMVHMDGEAVNKRKTRCSEHEDTVLGFVLQLEDIRNQANLQNNRYVKNLLVNNAFVLHRSGLLLTSFFGGSDHEMDHDIVWGMLTAVTDFVRDTFKDFTKDTPISSIRFNDKEIAFEHGKYLLLAFEVEGLIDQQTRELLAQKITEIEAQNENELDDWCGNLNHVKPVIDSLQEMMIPVE